MNRGKLWTTKEERRLAEMYAAGVPTKVIATELGRTTVSVQGRIKQLRRAGHPDMATRNKPWTTKEEQRLAEMYAAGVPTKVIAIELGRGVGAVRGRVQHRGLLRGSRRAYRAWRTSDKARLVELWRQGCTTREIAAELGRQEDGVKFYLRAARKELGTEVVPYRYGEGRRAK